MEQRTISSSAILNGLSVDVEDWFQVGAFENTIDRADWDGMALRVADNVGFVLDLFVEDGSLSDRERARSC